MCIVRRGIRTIVLWLAAAGLTACGPTVIMSPFQSNIQRSVAILIFGVLLLALPGLAAGAGHAVVGQPRQFVVLNFDNADIEVVIHAASEIVGFNYVLAPDVKGKVTVQTSSRIPQEEAFNVLLAILEVHGFTAVKSDTLYKIIRVEGARERPVPTIVGATPDPGRVGDEIITQIVPVRYSSVADLSKLLRPLVSARGSMIPHRETNLLIITDSASNIRRLLDIVKLVDVEVTLEELQIIPVKYADAQELAKILNQLFAPGRLRQPTPLPAVPAPAPPPRSQVPPVEVPGPHRPPFIAAYRGTNVLIVQARKPELETVRQLIAQLDVDIYAGRRLFIYFPEHVKAKDLAATLNAIYGGVEGAPTAPRLPRPPRGAPLPPPPAPPQRRRGAPAAPGASELGLAKGEVRFILDETTNAVIVIASPRNWPENEETRKETGPDAPEGTAGRSGGPARRLDHGFVIIDAMPADAQVFLDGRMVGSARQLVARAFPLPPGRHAIEILFPRFRPYIAKFTVSPSFPTRIRVALYPE